MHIKYLAHGRDLLKVAINIIITVTIIHKKTNSAES